MRLSGKVTPTEWLSRMLQRVEGLEVHRGSEPDSLSVSVNAGRRTNFEVLSIPVLSQEKADEPVRVWQDSAASASRRNRLIATQHLSSATRELLRENGISWIEERTGICRLFAPGLLVDVQKAMLEAVGHGGQSNPLQRGSEWVSTNAAFLFSWLSAATSSPKRNRPTSHENAHLLPMGNVMHFARATVTCEKS